MTSIWTSLRGRTPASSNPNATPSSPSSANSRSVRETVSRFADQMMHLPSAFSRSFATSSLSHPFSRSRGRTTEPTDPNIDSKQARSASASPSRPFGSFRNLPNPLRKIRPREARSAPPTDRPRKPMRRPGPVGRAWVKVYDDIIFMDDNEEDMPILGYTGSFPCVIPEAVPLPVAPTPPPEKNHSPISMATTPDSLERMGTSSPESEYDNVIKKRRVSPGKENLFPNDSLRVGRPRETNRYRGAKRQRRSATPMSSGTEDDMAPLEVEEDSEIMEDAYIIPQALKPPKPPRGHKLYGTLKREETEVSENKIENVPLKPKRGIKIYESIMFEVKDKNKMITKEDFQNTIQTEIIKDQRKSSVTEMPPKPIRGIKIYETIEIKTTNIEPNGTYFPPPIEPKEKRSVSPSEEKYLQDYTSTAKVISLGKTVEITQEEKQTDNQCIHESSSPVIPVRRSKFYANIDISETDKTVCNLYTKVSKQTKRASPEELIPPKKQKSSKYIMTENIYDDLPTRPPRHVKTQHKSLNASPMRPRRQKTNASNRHSGIPPPKPKRLGPDELTGTQKAATLPRSKKQDIESDFSINIDPLRISEGNTFNTSGFKRDNSPPPPLPKRNKFFITQSIKRVSSPFNIRDEENENKLPCGNAKESESFTSADKPTEYGARSNNKEVIESSGGTSRLSELTDESDIEKNLKTIEQSFETIDSVIQSLQNTSFRVNDSNDKSDFFLDKQSEKHIESCDPVGKNINDFNSGVSLDSEISDIVTSSDDETIICNLNYKSTENNTGNAEKPAKTFDVCLVIKKDEPVRLPTPEDLEAQYQQNILKKKQIDSESSLQSSSQIDDTFSFNETENVLIIEIPIQLKTINTTEFTLNSEEEKKSEGFVISEIPLQLKTTEISEFSLKYNLDQTETQVFPETKTEPQPSDTKTEVSVSQSSSVNTDFQAEKESKKITNVCTEIPIKTNTSQTTEYKLQEESESKKLVFEVTTETEKGKDKKSEEQQFISTEIPVKLETTEISTFKLDSDEKEIIKSDSQDIRCDPPQVTEASETEFKKYDLDSQINTEKVKSPESISTNIETSEHVQTSDNDQSLIDLKTELETEVTQLLQEVSETSLSSESKDLINIEVDLQSPVDTDREIKSGEATPKASSQEEKEVILRKKVPQPLGNEPVSEKEGIAPTGLPSKRLSQSDATCNYPPSTCSSYSSLDTSESLSDYILARESPLPLALFNPSFLDLNRSDISSCSTPNSFYTAVATPTEDLLLSDRYERTPSPSGRLSQHLTDDEEDNDEVLVMKKHLEEF